MNAPGVMQDDKHDHYLSDQELDAVLPATGYVKVVTPPPGYALMVAPRKLMGTLITEVGFHIQEGSDAAVVAAAADLAPELPAEIPGVSQSCIFQG